MSHLCMSKLCLRTFLGSLALAFGILGPAGYQVAQATPGSSIARPDHRTLTGDARAKEIARKVDLLADMAYGLNVQRRTPENGELIILKLAAENNGYTSIEEFEKEETFHRSLPSKNIEFGDMVGWGTMQIEAAKDLFASSDDSDSLKEARRAGFGQVLLQELSEMPGVSFGFTDGSSGYCGVSFMGLLIVDEENGVVYELSLTSSGPC